MTERQADILHIIIKQVIETAEPVGSNFLAENSDFNVSGATLRNEMRILEESGYLTHPHTSAGRIPTEQGYRYYVDHLMERSAAPSGTMEELRGLLSAQDKRLAQVKLAARYLAEYAGLAVIATPSATSIYYTGLSHLFRQPEMQVAARLIDVSTMFDHCEERIGSLITGLRSDDVTIYIGEKNPLGGGLGLVGVKLREGEILMVIGPMRMDYQRAERIVRLLSHIM